MHSTDLILLTSPPASGKTHWIMAFQEHLADEKILVISPLRALADECQERWGNKISMMTPEEWLGKKTFRQTVIFDEFHLYFYWGDTFRPLMWEAFFEITLHARTVILLTATLSVPMREEVTRFSAHFDSIHWIDQGNQVLKYAPARYIKAPSREWLLKLLESLPKNQNVRLIFCQYRQEVLQLEEHLQRLGYSCVSCVGGEAKYMSQKLKLTPRPDFIISTTVLSHGVNLPSISQVFFTYKISNLDFWIQMVARGGRKGEEYEVFALEKPHGIDWKPWASLARSAWLTLRMKLSPTAFTRSSFFFD